MTVPTEADYAATRSLLDGWPFDDNRHAYYADIGTCTLYYAIASKIAVARAEERERIASKMDRHGDDCARNLLPGAAGWCREWAAKIRSGEP